MKGSKWPLWTGVALCAVAVGWMGAVAFHQFRVRGLLRELRADVERYRPPSFSKTSRVLDILAGLQRHGCRAIPAIVDDFEPEAPNEYLDALSTILYTIMNDLSEDDYNPETRYQALNVLRALEITWRDDPPEKRRKCEGIRRWWAKEGRRYHQSWRFWSTNCAAK